MTLRRPRPVVALLSLLLLASVLPAAGAGRPGGKPGEDFMSSMGRLAVRARAAVEATGGRAHLSLRTGETCDNQPDCGDDNTGEGDSISGGQAEVSIAVDATGRHVVIGFNDTRGFALNPVSVSGFLYSDDGGVTFVDGGQLPSPGTDAIGATLLPQVFGDPEVKYLGACNFIYSSIVIAKFSATRAVQTMGVHRSTDCGHTWVGPFVVGPVTNPNGLVSGSGSPRDSADKEFMDVDPETGRVMLSWTNFTPVAVGGIEMSTTTSDDILTGNPPTWAARRVVSAVASDGQATVPRFAGNGSSNVYIAWRRFPFPGTFLGLGNVIAFARSTDNGATWGAPIEIAPEFFTMDQVLGNDRVNSSPSLAVDTSHGRRAGNIYVVYSSNDNRDGADIAFQRSTDGGSTFSAPLKLNSRPGQDRAQWFPWVTVDQNTGRVWVLYYDQGIAASGDLSETTVVFSDDGGVHWSAPQPLTDRPFHAAWGNDTGQPNLGDYNEAVAQNGELFAGFAVAFRPPLGFTDGQPTGSMTVPDVVFRRVPQGHHDEEGDDEGDDDHTPPSLASRPTNSLTVALAGASFTESGGNGNIDPGDLVSLKLTLRNYDTNPLSARRVEEPSAVLSTTTPGVTVVQSRSSYPDMSPGNSATNKKDFRLQIAPSFVPGTMIELVLTVRGEEDGTATLHHTLFTGTPLPTTLLAENFDGVAPGTLPAGWATVHAGGFNTVPWTTSSSFCGTGSNGAFHADAEDAPPNPGANVRFERLFSPAFVVPANASYVTVDLDVCYDTEDDTAFNIQARDGFFVRVTDLTPGRFLRSVLVDAFADEFTTGALQGFPKHFPRSSNPNYFADMAAWAGDSHGVQHVHMRLPGMAGSTAQLRFEYTQDAFSTCTLPRPGHSCGVLVDNIVVKSVVATTP
jgi:hypothetical protein